MPEVTFSQGPIDCIKKVEIKAKTAERVQQLINRTHDLVESLEGYNRYTYSNPFGVPGGGFMSKGEMYVDDKYRDKRLTFFVNTFNP